MSSSLPIPREVRVQCSFVFALLRSERQSLFRLVLNPATRTFLAAHHAHHERVHGTTAQRDSESGLTAETDAKADVQMNEHVTNPV
jgi:hypothetical protein